MDDDEIIFTPAPVDPIQTASECLIALSQAVDTTESYPARRLLIKMMENIVIYTTPPRAELITINGGKSGTTFN